MSINIQVPSHSGCIYLLKFIVLTQCQVFNLSIPWVSPFAKKRIGWPIRDCLLQTYILALYPRKRMHMAVKLKPSGSWRDHK